MQALDEEYQTALAEINEDFDDLEALGFLKTGLKDKKGRPTILVVAKNYPANSVSPERLYRCVKALGCKVSKFTYSMCRIQFF